MRPRAERAQPTGSGNLRQVSRVCVAMRAHDLEIGLCLLPCAGLLGCASAGELPVTQAELLEPRPVVDGWTDEGAGVEPLSLAEAAARSAELELAAGNAAAARAEISVAFEHEAELAALQLTRSEAALALGEFEEAETALLAYANELDDTLAQDELEAFDQSIANRRLDIRQRSRVGADSCAADVDSQRVALQRHADFVSVFSELRGHLREPEVLQIPLSEAVARGDLCEDDCEASVNFVRLSGEDEAIVGVLIHADDGGLYLVPELVRPDLETCADDTLAAYSRDGQRLHVRALSDTLGTPEDEEELEAPPVEDWRLGLQAELGRIEDKVLAAGLSSSGYYGYGSSGYGSSGYGSSGYGSSGYYSSGCGGYDDYDYDYYDGYYCEPVRTVQRDLFIDLARGEVILDITRTGSTSADFGRVEAQAASVELSACGVESQLPLSWTSREA